jgi:hypothetical protein
MRKPYIIAIATVFVLLFSALAFSQLNPSVTTESTFTFISAKMDLEERKTCTTEFYDEISPVYDACTFYHNYTLCLNTSGPDTDCSSQQSTRQFQCQTGSQTITKNKTTCTPNKEFIIEVDDGTTTLKKKIDYSDWGPCIREIQGNCLVVTCASYYDGAHNGQFTDCSGGKSCQKFEICDGNVRTYYKNSRNDFVEDDPTFYYKRLAVQEVGP